MAMSAKAENRVRRWKEQRWILDAVVNQIGVEFDQARVAYTAGPAGPEALAEFRAAASRIKKINDIDREFARAAVRREAKAAAFEKEGREVAARESYLTAALLWGIARWPIFELNEQLEHLEKKMNECFAKYIERAPHPIEKVEVPFGNQVVARPICICRTSRGTARNSPVSSRSAGWTAPRSTASPCTATSSWSVAWRCSRSTGRGRGNASPAAST